MAKYSALNQEGILADQRMMTPVKDSGWLAGFGNILGKEMADWFGTRRWWVQSLIWILVFNVALGLVLFTPPPNDMAAMQASSNQGGMAGAVNGLSVLFNTSALLGAIGVIILTQDEIIQEKQLGTAAWILTKPVSRASFILSKLVSNILGALVFIILIPAAIAYVEIQAATGLAMPLLPYIQALAVILLTLTFYIALTLMLGTFFDQRGPVLAAAFGLMFGGLILAQLLPDLKLGYILPVSMDKIALSLVQGQALSPAMLYALITAALFSVLFTVAALWRFGDEEF